jgi:hypothetical protein
MMKKSGRVTCPTAFLTLALDNPEFIYRNTIDMADSQPIPRRPRAQVSTGDLAAATPLEQK